MRSLTPWNLAPGQATAARSRATSAPNISSTSLEAYQSPQPGEAGLNAAEHTHAHYEPRALSIDNPYYLSDQLAEPSTLAHPTVLGDHRSRSLAPPPSNAAFPWTRPSPEEFSGLNEFLYVPTVDPPGRQHPTHAPPASTHIMTGNKSYDHYTVPSTSAYEPRREELDPMTSSMYRGTGYELLATGSTPTDPALLRLQTEEGWSFQADPYSAQTLASIDQREGRVSANQRLLAHRARQTSRNRTRMVRSPPSVVSSLGQEGSGDGFSTFADPTDLGSSGLNFDPAVIYQQPQSEVYSPTPVTTAYHGLLESQRPMTQYDTSRFLVPSTAADMPSGPNQALPMPFVPIGLDPMTTGLGEAAYSPQRVTSSPEGEADPGRSLTPRPKPQCWDHGCNGRQFSTFSNFLRHQREKSGAASKSTCPHCGAKFTRTTARNGHLAHDKCKAKKGD